MTVVYAIAIVAGVVVVLAAVLSSWAPSEKLRIAVASGWGFGLAGMAASFAGWAVWLALVAALAAAGALALWTHWLRVAA